MKFLWILAGLTLIIDATCSVSVETEITEVHEEDGKASEQFLQEVQEYFEQQRSKKPADGEPADRQTRHTAQAAAIYSVNTIYSGDTIALQTFVRSYWLGCSGTPCGRYPCPVMMMSGKDWINCGGEVFKIYRASGTGEVRVGDLVGLYYPAETGRWLDCSSDNCAKGTCPGIPTTAYGFATPGHWHNCRQSVFKIYAKGKINGAIINVYDDIAIYYLQDHLWVAQGYDQSTVKLPCLGTTLPPALNSYDYCAYETFTIWKRY